MTDAHYALTYAASTLIAGAILCTAAIVLLAIAAAATWYALPDLEDPKRLADTQHVFVWVTA